MRPNHSRVGGRRRGRSGGLRRRILDRRRIDDRRADRAGNDAWVGGLHGRGSLVPNRPHDGLGAGEHLRRRYGFRPGPWRRWRRGRATELASAGGFDRRHVPGDHGKGHAADGLQRLQRTRRRRRGETDIDSYGGISGIVDRRNGMFLVGVFLTDDPPSTSAPKRLDFTKGERFQRLASRVGQTFSSATAEAALSASREGPRGSSSASRTRIQTGTSTKVIRAITTTTAGTCAWASTWRGSEPGVRRYHLMSFRCLAGIAGTVGGFRRPRAGSARNACSGA
jgi:hypothetical protein